jgi:surface protein
MSAGRISSKLASTKNLGNQPTPWVRDPNWTTLPDITGQQKFVGLYAIFEESNYIALSATTSAGTYTVDWGDGSSTVAIASGTQANYLYDYATVSGSPITHNGLTYKQVIVTVTATTANLTGVNLNLKNTATGLTTGYGTGWLDIAVNGTNLTSITIAGSTNNVTHRLLESATIGQHSASFVDYSYMFSACTNLQNVSISSSSSVVTNMSSMFSSCTALTTVPLFNTAAVTNMSSMFSSCTALTTVPLFNTAAVTSMSSMFNNCSSLTTVPLFNTAAVTSMSSMFNNCSSLTTVPLFNTAAVNTMSSMFNGCAALTTVPLFNTAAVTSMGSMFNGCAALTTVPLFNTASVTATMLSMFSGCTSLTTVPLFNIVAATNMTSMFQNCTSLTTVPLFNTASVNTMSSMFNNCSSLTTVPLFNTASVNTMSSIFNGCSSLTSLPALNAASLLSLTTMFSTCASLTKIAMTGFKYTFSVAGLKLSRVALELLFSNLGIGTSQTLTITSNPGADTAVSFTLRATTAQSTTILMASTTGLSTGMSISGTGTGITTGAPVTFQDAGDTVTLANHGMSNDDMISFSVITTTTGIVINTIYYIISATTNTFQVASTLGGAALPLTTNGSGTMKYNAKIVTINTNISVVLDRPAATTVASTTLAFRVLNTAQARLRGWTISG